MNRRRLLLCATALATITLARAQRPVAVPRVALLWIDTGNASLPSAFRDGLRAQGYVDGKNVQIVSQFLVDRYQQLPEAAGRLVKENVDVIVTFGGTATLAASKATKTIPIVMVTSLDPVDLGVAASLSKPGGNVTGVTFLAPDLVGKRLQILMEVAPKGRRIGLLRNPESATRLTSSAPWQKAARALNVEVQLVEVRTPGDIDVAILGTVRNGVGALVVLASSFFTANREGGRERGREGPSAGVLRESRRSGRRRAHFIWPEPGGGVSAGGCLCGQDPEGREASGPSRRAAHAVRACRQSENGQGSRYCNSRAGSPPRGQGDRVTC